MSEVRKHILISLASSNGVMVINFVGAMFLARLLTPHEIGIFSVAYVFAGLLRTIREMGLGSYLVQEPELTHDRIRTAFGIAICIALITGLLLALLAGYASDFYREPGIKQVLYVIAASFLLVPFGASTMSLLRRDLKFREIAIIDLLGTLAQNLVAITLAWLDFGYMSLAWSSLAGIAFTILLVLFYRPADLPWRPSLKEWRRVLSFSTYVSGSSLVNYANISASDLVLGRMLNMESVAIFNRSYGLAELLGPVLLRAGNAVSMPYFARQHQGGTAILPGVIRVTSLIMILAVPIFSVMAIVAKPLILLLFGDQWTDSIPLLQILCIAAIFRAPTLLTPQIMVALAAVKQQFHLDVASLALRLTGIIYSAPMGLEAVAWSYCVTSIIISAMRLALLRKLIAFNWTELVRISLQSIVPTTLSILGPAIVIITGRLDTISTIILASLLAIAGWLFGTLLTDNPMRDEIRSAYKKTIGKSL